MSHAVIALLDGNSGDGGRSGGSANGSSGGDNDDANTMSTLCIPTAGMIASTLMFAISQLRTMANLGRAVSVVSLAALFIVVVQCLYYGNNTTTSINNNNQQQQKLNFQ